MANHTSSSTKFSRQTQTVAGATVLSRLLGLVREQVIAYYFGAGAMTDIFVTAFRIPNLLRDLFAEGAFSAAFVPTFTRVLEKEGRSSAFDLLNRVLSVFVPVLSLVCILGMAFTPQIVSLLSGGVEQTPGKIALLITMARWMFPFLLLVSLAAVFMGALNALGRFGIPALAPAGFNIGIILGAVVLSRWANPPLLALAWGVLLGGFLQWIAQAILAHRLGFRPLLRSGWRDSQVRHMAALMVPALLGLAAVQVNIFAITRFAWTLGDGPVAYLNYAFRVIFLPLGVFAVATATVGLPRLSQYAAAGETTQVRDTYRRSVRLVLFLVMPVALTFVVFADPICAVLYQRGRFDALASANTALALRYYSVGLPTMAVMRVTAPLFYAHHDTRTPALCGAVAVVSNLVGMTLLVGPMNFAGLALSVALSSVVQLTVLLFLAQRRYGPLAVSTLAGNFLTILLASVVAVGAGWGLSRWLVFGDGRWQELSGLLAVISVAAIIYLGITWLLGYRELGGLRRRTRLPQEGD